jgi:DNA-binding GntR family transcriptional regulator
MDITPIQAAQSIRDLLGLGRDEPVGRLRRLRRYQGRIVSYYINYFREEHLKRLSRAKLAKRPFIEVFQESTRIRLEKLEQRVESISAEMDLANVLNTEYGSPLFFIQNVYFANQDQPVVVTHMYYRGDSYAYTASIPFEGGPPHPERSFAVLKIPAAGLET